jgi:predicted SAM-dependent methyltransferase
MGKQAVYHAVNRMLRKAGFVLVPVRDLGDKEGLVRDYGLRKHDIARLNSSVTGGLRSHLTSKGQTRWLEVGCGGTLEEGFFYIDIFPEGVVDRSFRDKYFRVDIANASEHDLLQVGKFDLVRMQHVFEHFTPEEGRLVLRKCAGLLNPGGYLLITTPDLRIHANTYLGAGYKGNRQMESFNKSAWKRVDPNAPDSFYFSVFTHSLLYERHMWCYDFEGLQYLLRETASFEDIEELGLDHPLANFPFTHNRPEEDVCVLARKRMSA